MSAELAFEARTTLGALQLEVALQVAPGECVALAGPSGAGKSSILRIVAGLLHPREGRVRCAQETWLDTDGGVDLAPDRRRCGYVFQEYALFAHLTAWQNVAFSMRQVPRRARRERALELLERFGMAALCDARPQTLSGGERQRVALARALARTPRVLLLDEPLSALDARTRAAASRELQAILAEVGVPALLVTHDFVEAAALGHRVGVIDGGRVVQEGTAAELAAAPATAFVADFTGAVVLTGAAWRDDGVTRVTLDGGGELTSTDHAEGAVAASIFPWEVTIEPAGEAAHGSTRNRLAAEVVSVTEIGGRVRVGLLTPQPLAAEVTRESLAELGLVPGRRVIASFKATATRITPR
ncbi:MAG: ABC transporter ATP-binding protein [Solirubrobacteraceae bacterium]|nr:ABC transporter ATP-binding protein [Solirubrobacteraceae bacterium]